MAIQTLQHVNIRCADAAACRDFYVQAIGLTEGPRPPFNFPGHWLYLGEVAVIHLVQKPPGEAQARPGSGAIDHVAFGGSGLAEMRLRLAAQGIAFEERVVPRDGIIQLFVRDPEGIRLELNYPASEA